MAKRIGLVTYHEWDGMTLQDWREKWPDIPVHKTADGVYHVRALVVGSEARGALWHLKDYHVIGVGVASIQLAPRAIVD